MAAVFQTEIKELRLIHRGKVRDLYECGENILMVATDRLSAFDVVFDEPVPDKGKVLNQISLFWFQRLKNKVRNHVVEWDVERFPKELKPYQDLLRGRAVIVRKARPLAIECIVRGYITGSGWKEYQKKGTVCGIKLPEGLKEADRLPEPIFTPSTKAEMGQHDENIDFERACEIVGKEAAQKAKYLSIAIYKDAVEYALTRGIIIADTKFEFGYIGDELVLIDEVLTPDSSRFWPLDSYKPGGPQPSFDKQFVRDYLEAIGWDKKPPAPHLPDEIVEKTRKRYLEAYKRITGQELNV